MEKIQKTNSNDLKAVIEKFRDCHIAVVGDVIVDKFVWGQVSRISPEAPVPVVNVKHEELMLGGAANVINNIVSLGGKVSIFGLLGDDSYGEWASKALSEKSVNTDGLSFDPSRKTSIKTRIIANKQQVVRIDDEITDEISDQVYKKMILNFEKNVDTFDAVIVSDYCKGVISEKLIAKLNTLSDKKPVLVDPKVANFKYYKDVFIATPNTKEACTFTQTLMNDDLSSVIESGKEIIDRLKCKHLLITRGEHGMLLFENNKSIVDIPTVAKEVSDVSGAGDTVISVLALCVASGASLRNSAYISNIAAGLVVAKLGTASTNYDELIGVI